MISFTELTEKLLNREAMIVCEAPSTQAFPITANYTNKPNGNNWRGGDNNNNNWRGNNNNNNWRGGSSQYRNNSRQPRQYLGKCQACGTVGHSVQRCPTFRVVAHTDSSRPSANQTSFTPMQANTAAYAPVNPDHWLMDSGTSHHITSDLNQLALHQP